METDRERQTDRQTDRQTIGTYIVKENELETGENSDSQLRIVTEKYIDLDTDTKDKKKYSKVAG